MGYYTAHVGDCQASVLTLPIHLGAGGAATTLAAEKDEALLPQQGLFLGLVLAWSWLKRQPECLLAVCRSVEPLVQVAQELFDVG